MYKRMSVYSIRSFVYNLNECFLCFCQRYSLLEIIYALKLYLTDAKEGPGGVLPLYLFSEVVVSLRSSGVTTYTIDATHVQSLK